MVEKICKHCNYTKPLTEFVKSTYVKSGYRAMCKSCFNAYYAKRRIEKYDLVRQYEKKFHTERRIRSLYKTTPEYIENLKQAQQNLCAICEQQVKLVIDHCHKTNRVRGLLCAKCNSGLGLFQDSFKNLKKAQEYLLKFNG